MKVKACMTKNVISVGVDEPVAEAARLMSRYNLGSLPVCTAQGRLCGMLSLGDLARNGSFSAQTAQCMEAICAPVVRLD